VVGATKTHEQKKYRFATPFWQKVTLAGDDKALCPW
jgi:hypothetical protein